MNAHDLIILFGLASFVLTTTLILMLAGADLIDPDQADERHGREQAALFDQDAALAAAVRTVTDMRGGS